MTTYTGGVGGAGGGVGRAVGGGIGSGLSGGMLGGISGGMFGNMFGGGAAVTIQPCSFTSFGRKSAAAGRNTTFFNSGSKTSLTKRSSGSIILADASAILPFCVSNT